jgi:hypothetical protein
LEKNERTDVRGYDKSGRFPEGLSLVTPAATHIDETKSPFRFSRKGLERSNLN